MTDKNLNALAAMGLTPDEVAEADRKITEKTKAGNRDRRICVCGHAVSKHSNYAGVLTCKPSALLCPCKKVHPVLESSDTRVFLRKTEGAGAMHALSRGIYAAIQSGKDVKWIIDLKCDRCGSTEANVVPVPVTQSGYSADYATGFDALLCADCRTSI